MGFFSSRVGRKAAAQETAANTAAIKELETIFGVSEAEFSGAQQQFRDDFLRQRNLTEEGFDPFIQAGTRALEDVEAGGTVGGLDARIQEILESDAFQTLKGQGIKDLQLQQAASGLRRGDAFEEIANISPELAFQIENQLFGRNRDLADLGFEGVERRGAQGTQLTLGQGQLSSGALSIQEQLRALLGGDKSKLITASGKARSAGLLADQQINQQNIQNVLNAIGTASDIGVFGRSKSARGMAGRRGSRV